MDRRESIRSLFLGSMAGGLALESCVSAPAEEIKASIWKYQYGRTPDEAKRDEKLLNSAFFDDSELSTITHLANLILPPAPEGTIEQADVPQFIEFMSKDYPPIQIKIRGGLMWLDHHSNKKYGESFMDCQEDQQLETLDLIAYPDLSIDSDDQKQEVAFFSLMRNLVLTGYFTSEVGIKELGYQGNQPNVWDGVPSDVLKEHGFSYDDWTDKFADPANRNDTAIWDENGNLIS